MVYGYPNKGGISINIKIRINPPPTDINPVNMPPNIPIPIKIPNNGFDFLPYGPDPVDTGRMPM
jgi:hypothetical protein